MSFEPRDYLRHIQIEINFLILPNKRMEPTAS